MGKLSLGFVQKVIICSLLGVNVARADLSSTKFPDAQGSSTAVAADSNTVIVGTDAGYLEVMDRNSGKLKSIQIYQGPYRATSAVYLNGGYAYAVTSGYSIVKVDLSSAQVVDELKVSQVFNYIDTFQIFGSTAYVSGYAGSKQVLFKLNLNEGSLSAIKPEIIPLPLPGFNGRVNMVSETIGLAIVVVNSQVQLAKFDLSAQTSTVISSDIGRIVDVVGVSNGIAFLRAEDLGSTDSTDDIYLALDLQTGNYILPFSKTFNTLPVLGFAVSGDSMFIASWNDGLVVRPVPQGYKPGSPHPQAKTVQPFPIDLFQTLGEASPQSFQWTCESVTQYGIPAEWKIDFGITSLAPTGSDQKSKFTVLFAQRDWLKDDGIHYFKRYETGTVHNDDGEFTVGFAKPGAQTWDVEGVLSAWMNHNVPSPLEIKIWLQRSPSISSSAIKLQCTRLK